MSEQLSSLIRSALKVAGASLVTKGITSDASLEAIIGGIIALVGVVMSYRTHKQTETEKPQ